MQILIRHDCEMLVLSEILNSPQENGIELLGDLYVIPLFAANLPSIRTGNIRRHQGGYQSDFLRQWCSKNTARGNLWEQEPGRITPVAGCPCSV